MRGLSRVLAVTVCWWMIVGLALPQRKQPANKTGLSDAAYIAKALTAAPPGLAKAAGVARIDSPTHRTHAMIPVGREGGTQWLPNHRPTGMRKR